MNDERLDDDIARQHRKEAVTQQCYWCGHADHPAGVICGADGCLCVVTKLWSAEEQAAADRELSRHLDRWCGRTYDPNRPRLLKGPQAG